MYNVIFPEKLEKFSGILFLYNVNFPGKLEKFSGIYFIQNGSIKCAHEWNRSEIFIDSDLARG